MLVTIHQPEHLPWPGLLNKIMQADIFVLLDTVQYRKNYFQNRNKICTKDGIIWLSLPIEKFSHSTLIKDIQINKHDKHFAKWLRIIEDAYRGFPFYDSLQPTIKVIHSNANNYLSDFNISIIKFMLDYLDIETECVLASDLCLPKASDSTDANLSICKILGADKYLSGPSGKDYLQLERFHYSGIDVIFHEYSPPNYSHPYVGFMPGISFIDAMMLYGPESKRYL